MTQGDQWPPRRGFMMEGTGKSPSQLARAFPLYQEVYEAALQHIRSKRVAMWSTFYVSKEKELRDAATWLTKEVFGVLQNLQETKGSSNGQSGISH